MLPRVKLTVYTNRGRIFGEGYYLEATDSGPFNIEEAFFEQDLVNDDSTTTSGGLFLPSTSSRKKAPERKFNMTVKDWTIIVEGHNF